MAAKKPVKKNTKKEKKEKQPRNPNVGYITHDKNGKVALGRTVEEAGFLVGSSVEEIDQPRPALRPGRRVSRGGNVYYENRRNRADMNPMQGL